MPCGRLLSDIDRQVIARGIKDNKSHRAIAKQIGRSQSVVFREVERNSTPRGYNVVVAKNLTAKRAKKTNMRKLDHDPELRAFVVYWIREGLSPEEVAGRRKMMTDKNRKGCSVSHEAIYDWIYYG